MKKKKIIGIVLILAALVCVYAGISVRSSAPKTAETVINAVYISDGKVHPENEGKVVIVPGTLDSEPFVDQETGIKISSAVAFRYVEKLYIAEDREKKTEYWEWKTDAIAFGGEKKVLAPNVSLGEFSVTEELLQTFTTNKKRTSYDRKELDQMGWQTFTDGGQTYLYQGDRMPRNEDGIDAVNTWIDKYAYQDYVGTYRVAYAEMDGSLDCTIVALQRNGRLERVPGVVLRAVHSGHLTQAEILEYEASSAKGGAVVSYVLAVAFLGAGVFLLIRKEKKNS